MTSSAARSATFHVARRYTQASLCGRVLLVTSDLRRVAPVRELLLRRRYAVAISQSFHAVRRQVNVQPFDLLLLDLDSAVFDALTLSRRLRADGTTLPIVMLHMAGTADDLLEGFDAGADAYLRGVYRPADVLGEVWACCRSSAPPASLDGGGMLVSRVS